MKRVLVLGAGQSAPVLIRHLLEASEEGFEVVVADLDLGRAAALVGRHPRGRVLALNADDRVRLLGAIRASTVVVNFLAPQFQAPVAELCVEAGCSMVSASYRSSALRALEPAARARGLTLVSELGLDPGLDHMSAMRLLARIRDERGRARRFWSYGSGVADLDTVANPLGYAVTWNPRNVVTAGVEGARYLDGGRVRVVPYPEIFRRTWSVRIPGESPMEAYLNRDAVGYVELYGLEEAETVVRATLRHRGFCETWYAVARLGLAHEKMEIPGLPELRWRDLVEALLPAEEGPVEARASLRLGLHPHARAIENLEWLGLFSCSRVGEIAPDARTPAEAMIALLQQRLALPPGGRDLVILHHVVEVAHRDGDQLHTSTLVSRGEPGGPTAMARAVGLPAALATLDLVRGTFPLTGCPIPTASAIHGRLLPRVEAAGLSFVERSSPVSETDPDRRSSA